MFACCVSILTVDDVSSVVDGPAALAFGGAAAVAVVAGTTVVTAAVTTANGTAVFVLHTRDDVSAADATWSGFQAPVPAASPLSLAVAPNGATLALLAGATLVTSHFGASTVVTASLHDAVPHGALLCTQPSSTILSTVRVTRVVISISRCGFAVFVIVQ